MGITSQASLGSDWINEQCDRFRLLALSYQDFARSAGIDLLPFRDPALPHFTALPVSQRALALDALSACVRVCEGARNEGHAMSDSPGLAWQAIRQLGLRPTSDIFGMIWEDCVIEIHSPDGVQIFRNFNFFRFCTYSIEELYSLPWNTLFTRDLKIVEMIADRARKVYSGSITSATRFNVPTHIVREVASPTRTEIRLSMEWIAPLYRERTQIPEATITVETAEFVHAAHQGLPVGSAQSGVSSEVS